MTDEYGFGAAASSALILYEMTQRGSGRTARMIERAQDGDQIVCANGRECDRIFRLLAKARKSNVRVFVVNENHPLSRMEPARGRTFFDHGWILQHFENALKLAARDLEHFQRATSKTWPEAPPPMDSKAVTYLDTFARNR